MAWSSTRSWSVGEVLTAANMNTYVSDNTDYLKGNAGAVTINDAIILAAGTAPAGTDVYIVNDNSGDLTLNALTGKSINLAIAGTDEVKVTGGGLLAVNAAGPAFVNEATTTTNPTLCPNQAELDTGIGWASDTLHFVLGGVSYGNISTTNLSLSGGIATGGATPNGRHYNRIQTTFTSDGSTSSAAGSLFLGTVTGASGDISSLSLAYFDGGIITQTAVEDIGYVSTIILDEPTITKNLTGNITIASTLTILAAPTEGVTNAAIYVVSGDTNIDTLTTRGNVDVTGDITVTGTVDGVDVAAFYAGHGAAQHTDVTRKIFIPATGYTDGTNEGNYGRSYYTLPDGQDKVGYFTILIPDDFVSYTSIKAVWHTAGGGGNMRWALTGYYNTDGEGITTTQDTSTAGETAGVTNTIEIQEPTDPLTLTGLAAGDILGVELTRYGSHSNDTLSSDAHIWGIIFEYVANQ